MEYLLFFTVFGSLAISFFCSMSEAALFAVSFPHVRRCAEEGGRSWRIVEGFKADMARPISAILVLNTVANTTGPAIGGVAAEALFGEAGVIGFAIFMSAAILFLGEIVPKFVGVTYCKQIAPLTAWPLLGFIRLFAPIIALSQAITRRLEPEQEHPSVSHEEVLSMAALGAEEGTLDHLEGSIISNVIGLDKILVRDILTPRVMVFRVNENMTLAEVQPEIPEWNFTRIPLFNEDDPDHLTGYVRQRDVYRALLLGDLHRPIKAIARRLHTVPELMRADKLLLQMLEDREHICGVVDEHGALAGVVSMEDILEEIVGREIVDEYDVVR
ncbi:MAG: HlyC/CorC family transporter [Proteobacteria bacterium]|nr:HlyC/CorC family transporter [Pseudomonadota bacterium]